MAIAPKLKLKQSQSLVMTPQLQQAIKLLQLSNIELAAYVEEQLESNPLLERGTGTENRREESESASKDDAVFEDLSLDAPSTASSDSLDAPADAIDSEASPADVGGSVDWSRASTGGSFNRSQDFDPAAQAAAEITLSDHLSRQAAMMFKSPSDALVAQYFIDHVDENGYLRLSLEDAGERLNVSQTRLLSILTQLQTLDPVGVFARDLQECLTLQLKDRGLWDDATDALIANLHLLAKHDLAQLRKLCDISMEQLDDMISAIRTLAPKPGLAYGHAVIAAVEPDVFVRETPNGGWAVELNSDTLPHVLVNHRYFAEICGPNADEQTRTFMTEAHQNANWLVKSLDQRARTILKVATEIVRQQDGFFAYGVDHMRPLNLKTIAEAIDMHESTVSRVTSNKFMATPRGNFEFKYFFSAAIPALAGGEAHSAETVRHRIKVLISEETATSVFSDDKLVQLLRGEGIDVARRTVAKYRESLGIPSSVTRRRILKNAQNRA